jgi:hypothetical protein
MGKFQDLKVWKRGKDLAGAIYKLTGHGIFSKDWGSEIRSGGLQSQYIAILQKATNLAQTNKPFATSLLPRAPLPKC